MAYQEPVAHLYKVTNKVTGEYYIGKHNGYTQNGYWGSGRRITRQVKKYGTGNFTYQILVISTQSYILELEQKMVTTKLISEDNKCLNLVSGGIGGRDVPDNVRQKIRKARQSQQLSEESYGKISDTMSTLKWMNDGKRSYRIRPENVAKAIQDGLTEGRFDNYISDKYKEKLKMQTKNQWQKVKETGHNGHLIKV